MNNAPLLPQTKWVTTSEELKKKQEGYIVQFQNGEQQKFKSKNYMSLHRGMLDLTTNKEAYSRSCLNIPWKP